MGQFTPEQLAFLSGLPAWVDACWAIAVWGGVVGAILLLVRRSQAVSVFLASLIALIITVFQNYVLSNGLEVMGDPFYIAFTAAIFVGAVALYLYAREMRRRKVLV